MEESSRREFVKRSALILAGGTVLAASSVGASGDRKDGTKVVLYRETEEWKQYYESLE